MSGGPVAGDLIGPYELVAELGRGGYGTVWRAERREPFRQVVAIKFLRFGVDSRAVVARFDRERQVLAVMNHPGIARVLDGGLRIGHRGPRGGHRVDTDRLARRRRRRRRRARRSDGGDRWLGAARRA